MELVQHTESDAWLALSLAMHLNLLPLSRQLSCLSGSLWARTLQARPLPSTIHGTPHTNLKGQYDLKVLRYGCQCSFAPSGRPFLPLLYCYNNMLRAKSSIVLALTPLH